ncbi:hypothetical protein WH95_19850 [Kiloniella litopenaei]|uniref:Uncharacterized protein n=1 Tax=Kiloniella litopenaei TaxID=1549748 RepID=A0A0M2R5D0_9PROT|nr:hypothetical protein [Kiloniella litopenaei]KKJ75175.1 hypothetical protein WH95_19850 [Kiloniella litopenaei]
MWNFVFLSFLFVFSISSIAVAQSSTRCQCDYNNWVGNCQASIELDNNWFKITTNTQQCSRVDWYADSNPKVTIVTGGLETEEWLGRSKRPELTLQSCKICRDTNLLPRNPENPPSTNHLDISAADARIMGTWSCNQQVKFKGQTVNCKTTKNINKKVGTNRYLSSFSGYCQRKLNPGYHLADGVSMVFDNNGVEEILISGDTITERGLSGGDNSNVKDEGTKVMNISGRTISGTGFQELNGGAWNYNCHKR